ncbi:MFS transporter [Propionibacteriaceae bacterium G1746]
MSSTGSFLKQPKGVWAVAFACVTAFMGIGLVDPILPAISNELDASPSQAMLLFTSYLVITGIAMLFTSWVSSRLGAKKTLLLGLALIVVFATAAGGSDTVNQIIGFRAGWGLGNALFISTALAAIVGSASGGISGAIMLYEAAMGVGLATGPLLGGLLGDISWRGPFFGTAALMAIGFLLIAVLLPRTPRPAQQATLTQSFSALRHPALRTLAMAAVFYNYAFFALLAYAPFPVEAAGAEAGLHIGPRELGFVFFGWGLSVAITSVLVAPVLMARFGRTNVLVTTMVLFAADLALLALSVHDFVVLIVGIAAGGLLIGVLNTVFTESVMEATDLPRGVASSAYSGVRFLGGAVSAGVAGPIAAQFGAPAPFLVAIVALAASCIVLAVNRPHLHRIDQHLVETPADEAMAISVGDA